MATEPGDFSLRDGVPADYPFVAGLYRATMEPLLSALGAWDEGAVMRRFEQNTIFSEVQIIEVGSVDAGWFQISDLGDRMDIAQIHLLEPYRSRGIGGEIIESICARAAERGLPVTLAVVRNNPAKALYERMGFEIEDDTDPIKYYLRWSGPLARAG
jgi:ribosomal protein S18 acetylase RimI-like enzyme